MKLTKISNIFDINIGTNLDYIDTTPTYSQPILYASRKATNHGIRDVIEKIFDQIPNEKLTITVPLGGNGILTANLQPFEYYSGKHLFILKPKMQMNVQTMLYYCWVIRSNKFRYTAFGREANTTFSNILIPDISEIPSFINNSEILNLLKYKQNFTNKNEFDKKIKIIQKANNFKKFKLLDIFNIAKGGSISEEIVKDLPKGNINFISATSNNNGTKFKVEINSLVTTIYKSETLSLAKNGNVCQVFYQDEPFIKTSDVLVLESKIGRLNLNSGLFFKWMIEKSKFKFNYGRKINSNRIDEIYLLLPCQEDDKPDLEIISSFFNIFKELKKFK